MVLATPGGGSTGRTSAAALFARAVGHRSEVDLGGIERMSWQFAVADPQSIPLEAPQRIELPFALRRLTVDSRVDRYDAHVAYELDVSPWAMGPRTTGPATSTAHVAMSLPQLTFGQRTDVVVPYRGGGLPITSVIDGREVVATLEPGHYRATPEGRVDAPASTVPAGAPVAECASGDGAAGGVVRCRVLPVAGLRVAVSARSGEGAPVALGVEPVEVGAVGPGVAARIEVAATITAPESAQLVGLAASFVGRPIVQHLEVAAPDQLTAPAVARLPFDLWPFDLRCAAEFCLAELSAFDHEFGGLWDDVSAAHAEPRDLISPSRDQQVSALVAAPPGATSLAAHATVISGTGAQTDYDVAATAGRFTITETGFEPAE